MTSTRRPPAPEGFAHHFKRVDGLRFHYIEGGRADAPALVLLAGYPQSSFAWHDVMTDLRDRYRVLAIDLPGQGDSDKPLDGYDTQTVAERLHGLVQKLDIEPYFLAAHDVGAWVAFPYTHLFEDEIRALVLMDAGIPGVTLPEHLPSDSDRSWKTWHFPFHAVPDLPEILLEGRERPYLEWFFREKAAHPGALGEAALTEYLRIFTAPGALRAGLAFYRAGGRSAAQNKRLAQARRLSLPVLGLGADHGSIPDLAGALAPFCEDIHSDVIANCGHFQAEEQPQAVAVALLRFFGEAAEASS
ncbi:alpha/beta hydrolase [Mesobaculum littorinae]|uniref:Alpha/beta hydrolase n=1 Tax=Mesobaculum littorinae TaxID=2486419 RepID=A0A438AER2_9RHOB|nr:alpha/beta hydrolase [Mesobaculum littorinae]RVV97162.1 alpha/beta hydrolase [Mesobaculum littorinae]